MPIGRDNHHRDARAVHAAVDPAGSLGEAAVAEELLRGPLPAEWAVLRRMSLTCNDLQIADQRPDIVFALSLETTAA